MPLEIHHRDEIRFAHLIQDKIERSRFLGLGPLGGLAAFGMIGLFMGPVILAVMVAVWREWLEDAEEQQQTPEA